jgi:hypothetical protein
MRCAEAARRRTASWRAERARRMPADRGAANLLPAGRAGRCRTLRACSHAKPRAGLAAAEGRADGGKGARGVKGQSGGRGSRAALQTDCARGQMRVNSPRQINGGGRRSRATLPAEGGGIVAMATELSVMLKNQPGALAELCSKLAEKAVNILGLMVPEQSGVAPVRLVVNAPDVAKKIFDSMGVKYTERDVLNIPLSDKPGALGKVTRKLADRKIDVKYAYGTILKGAGKANVILGVADPVAASEFVK